MQFDDLTPYVYAPELGDPPALNIGWLGDRDDFSIAQPFAPFLDQLGALCRKPVNLMRGFHVCELCGFDPMYGETNFDGFLGNGEIRAEGLDGTVYAAPVMIYHYVRDHHYAPPAAFREAVMQYCRLCAGRLEGRIDGWTQGLYCPACREWDVVATCWPPVTRGGERYTLTVLAGDLRSTTHVKAIAALTRNSYLQARERLKACPVVRYRAQALDIVHDIATLKAAGLIYAVEPSFAYTQADADAAGMRPPNARRFIDAGEVEAPRAVSQDPLIERLETPETYPGLAPKASSDRELLMTRQGGLGVKSAYALFGERDRWILRRIEVGWTRSSGGWADVGGWASFGTDAQIEPEEANDALRKAARLRRVCEPELGSMIVIDGPRVYEVCLGDEVFRYLSPEPAFEPECAAIDELMSELDRMLPQSTLRSRT